MSLRQRGQRPSEATDEGGLYHAATPRTQPPPPQTPRQQQPHPPSTPSSTGSGYGYYNHAGYAANPTTPATTSYGGQQMHGHGHQSTPVERAPSRQMYASTAPPAYHYQNNICGGGGGPAPRVLDPGPYGYGSYGGYGHDAGGIGSSGIGGVAAPSSAAANPYQTSKPSSSGIGLKDILLSVIVITVLALTGTAIHYRGMTKVTEAELAKAREHLERSRESRQKQRREERTGGRFAQAGGRGAGGANYGNDQNAEQLKLKGEIDRIREKIKSQEEKQAEFDRKDADYSSKLESLMAKKQDLLKAMDHARNELEDAAEETAKYKAMVDGREEVEAYMKRREGALWKRIDALEGRIGRESWREAAEWFGPGPHRVELELEYPKLAEPESDPSTWPRVRNYLVIEMAPLDLMPHTVNLFLMQVHHGLWDGCKVVSNAPHIFQLGPSYEDDDGANNPAHFNRFHEMGMAKVSYQEYSAEYPHKQWTVGLAGRPGGPDFYINKLDNTLIHGPGGQVNGDDMHNEADPCFGMVADGGTDILEEIGKIPTGENNALMLPVVVVSAKVLVTKENPAEGWREVPRGEKFDGEDGIMPLGSPRL